jgi:hypothetical protein
MCSMPRRDHHGGLYVGDYQLIAPQCSGSFRQLILAKKKSTGCPSSSNGLFALKIVPHPCVSTVEKEVLI